MKQHPIYTGYFGSEDGEIYSNKNKNSNFKKLKPQKHVLGYKLYFLSHNGKRIGTTGHRFIAECFLPNVNNFSDVHHLDENKQNNSVFNLEWTTHKENCQYTSYKNGKTFIGKNLKTNEEFEIFNLSKWCKDNRICRTSVYLIISGKRKTTGGFTFKKKSNTLNEEK